MAYQDFLYNKENGKLIQYAYDLHQKDFKRFPYLPRFEFYEGCGLYHGKNFKDGGMYGNVSFDNHSDSYALITLVVARGLDKNHQNPKSALFLQTNTKDYIANFHDLIQDKETGKLVPMRFDSRTENDYYEEFIDYLVYLGFRREDVIKVMNHQMTAREAYQNVAKEEDKNKQWICHHRKFYEFDGNVAISGDYGSVTLDRFPFPFEEQPILDCSKVKTTCVRFGSNQRKVKMIHVNSNPDSIVYTDIREAIIDEEIDASKVRISGTKFGEQTVINLDQSIDSYDEEDLDLAYTDSDQKEKVHSPVKIYSNASDVSSMIEGIGNGASGIGLFRDEIILERNPEIVAGLLDAIPWGYCSENASFLNHVYQDIYQNASKMYSISEDKPVIFRLSDIKVDELLKKSTEEIDPKEILENGPIYRGADLLFELREVLYREVRAIIRAAKEHQKPAIILVPYFDQYYSFIDIKNRIMNIAKEEDYDNIQIGAMIETVESARQADDIAEDADFISIGTNDLTESVLGKERSISDPDFSILHDDVKKTIQKIVHRVKRKNNIPINICGEHANNNENLDFYLSLDIDAITCNPNLVAGHQEYCDGYLKTHPKIYLKNISDEKK